VIRLDRHATTDQLASLAADALSPRKAARISAHVIRCDRCTHVTRQLDAVPATLASAQYPPMPASLTIQIEAAFRAEATQRLSAMPATEGGRGDLPARHRRQATRRGWHLPGLSVPATRLVAAAGALAIVAAGTYELASHASSGPTASSVAGSAAAPATGQPMSLGPQVTYGQPNALHTIHAVQSSSNFLPAKLTTQAVAAVHAAQAKRLSGRQPTSGTPGASRAQSSSGVSAAPSSGIARRLADCINLIAPGRTVLLLDMAKFDGKPATIIVVAALAASPAEAWVVGSTCSSAGKDVLDHAVLSHV
jgi:hypothetical protein